MRGKWLSIVAFAGLGMTTVSAEPRTPSKIMSAMHCDRVAEHVLAVVGDPPVSSDKVRVALASRCEVDHWSQDVQICFTAAASMDATRQCLDGLTGDQEHHLVGDLDRLGDATNDLATRTASHVARTALRRPLIARPVGSSMLMTATLVGGGDLLKARALHDQGVAAYQAGKYDFAIRKFTAAFDNAPSPALLYQLAQAYRLKGQRAKAVEQYKLYLQVAPDGPASDDCREQLERLADSP